MRLPLLLLGSIALSAGCRSPAVEREKNQAAATPSAQPSTQAFGAKLGVTPRTPLASVLERPEQYAGKTVVVEGHVRRACSRKGCWMELSTSPAPEAPKCRVTFKDYGFFVPTDSEGSSARLEAAVELARLEPRQVEHLEREGAKFTSKQPDGSASEVRLVASGVELWR